MFEALDAGFGLMPSNECIAEQARVLLRYMLEKTQSSWKADAEATCKFDCYGQNQKSVSLSSTIEKVYLERKESLKQSQLDAVGENGSSLDAIKGGVRLKKTTVTSRIIANEKIVIMAWVK